MTDSLQLVTPRILLHVSRDVVPCHQHVLASLDHASRSSATEVPCSTHA